MGTVINLKIIAKIVAAGMNAVLALTGVPHPDWDQSAPNAYDGDEVKWSCQPGTWTKTPQLYGDVLKAEISANCEFDAVSKGGYPELESYLFTQIPKMTHRVIEGPVPETYLDMPSNRFEVEVGIGDKKDGALIHESIHIATDRTNALAFGGISKKIEGWGNSKYLNKIDLDYRVSSSSVLHHYILKASNYFELRKPWFVPRGTFLSEVKKRIEAEVPGQAKKIIVEYAHHI